MPQSGKFAASRGGRATVKRRLLLGLDAAAAARLLHYFGACALASWCCSRLSRRARRGPAPRRAPHRTTTRRPRAQRPTGRRSAPIAGRQRTRSTRPARRPSPSPSEQPRAKATPPRESHRPSAGLNPLYGVKLPEASFVAKVRQNELHRLRPRRMQRRLRYTTLSSDCLERAPPCRRPAPHLASARRHATGLRRRRRGRRRLAAR